MKILKIILSIFLFVIIIVTGGIIFSNNIVSYMTNTKNSKFENIKYSVENGTMTFENFIVNKMSLGKGEAKIHLDREGFLGLVPSLKISEIKLENVDFNNLNNEKNKMLENFLEKIEDKYPKIEEKETLEQFLKNVEKNVDNLDNEINIFSNQKISGNIDKINQMKQDYNKTEKINEKSIKLSSLKEEISNLSRAINNEKIKYEEKIEEIELEKNKILLDLTLNVEQLKQQMELNNENKLNEYIFLDKKEIIKDIENRSLKLIDLVNEIKKVSLNIEKIEINNGTIKIFNINQEKLSVEATLQENFVIKAEGNLNNYNINVQSEDIVLQTKYEINKEIFSDIIYFKKNLIQDKIVEIESILLFKDGKIGIENKTVLTDEDKNLLNIINSDIEIQKYNEKINEYNVQNDKIDEFVNRLKESIAKLEKIQKDVMKLDVIIPLNTENLHYLKFNQEEEIQNNETKDKKSENKNLNDFIGKVLGKKGSK